MRIQRQNEARLPPPREPTRLPTQFPAGTHYVVEGETGPDGIFRITSRRLEFPNGAQMLLPQGGTRQRTVRAGGACERKARIA
jgi:hypothetical protein